MSDEKTTPPTLATVVDTSLQELDLGIAIMPQPGEVAKVDYRELHRLKLLELSKQVDALPEITDAKAYEVNQKKRTELVGTRTGLDRRRKELFAPLRALKEEVDGYIGTTPDAGLQGQVKALERRIEAKQEEWNAKQEEIRQEEIRQEEIRQAALRIIEERNAARARRLVDAGMKFDGSAYVLLDLRVFPIDINALDDAAFESWWDTVLGPALIAKGEADRIAEEERQKEEERIERKRKEAEELERQQRETFERQAREQKRLDDERAPLDREREDMRRQRNEQRYQRLESMGLFRDPSALTMKLLVNVGQPGRSIGDEFRVWDLKDIDNADEAGFAAIIGGVQECLREAEENHRKNALLRDRSLVLINLGVEHDEAGVWSLGNCYTTDHLIANASDEDWTGIEALFNVERQSLAMEDDMLEKEAADQAVEAVVDQPDEHQAQPLSELLACTLALLDEANKIATVPEDYNEDHVRCADRVINVVGPLVSDIRSTIKAATR